MNNTSPHNSGDYSAEFAELVSFSQLTRRQQLGKRLVNMKPMARVSWLSSFVQWIAERGPTSFRPSVGAVIEELPSMVSNRVAAAQLTNKVAGYHSDFRRLSRSADAHRDKGEFAEAERAYSDALRIFPLHGGYHVQFAHMLKERGNFLEAFLQYCFALALGAPLHDVEEHLLFAAHRASLKVDSNDVQRLSMAWEKATKTGNTWDAPPIETDFIDYARLLWGNTGLLTPNLLSNYVLKCTNRKDLLIAMLQNPETARHNREFFVMIKERGFLRG
jgi:tetratricopeptide (TPR) repeat protein